MNIFKDKMGVELNQCEYITALDNIVSFHDGYCTFHVAKSSYGINTQIICFFISIYKEDNIHSRVLFLNIIHYLLQINVTVEIVVYDYESFATDTTLGILRYKYTGPMVQNKSITTLPGRKQLE